MHYIIVEIGACFSGITCQWSSDYLGFRLRLETFVSEYESWSSLLMRVMGINILLDCAFFCHLPCFVCLLPSKLWRCVTEV